MSRFLHNNLLTVSLPGSEEVYDRGSGLMLRCNSTLCPLATSHPAVSGPGTRERGGQGSAGVCVGGGHCCMRAPGWEGGGHFGVRWGCLPGCVMEGQGAIQGVMEGQGAIQGV